MVIMKGRPLLPTLRTKKRYVVYEALSEQPMGHKSIVKTITQSYKDNFGFFGLGNAGIMDTKIHKKNRGIIKVNNKYLDNFKTSMAMVTKINKKEVLLHTVAVSGILKKAKAKLGG